MGKAEKAVEGRTTNALYGKNAYMQDPEQQARKD